MAFHHTTKAPPSRDPETAKPRRRQWGSDRRRKPLPPVPAPISQFRVACGRLAVVTTLLAWLAFVILTVREQISRPGMPSLTETIGYLVVITALTASALAYLTTRLGFFYRASAHQRTPRASLEAYFAREAPPLTVLVPSYQEDERIIRMTLLSAALQEYPDQRVVLLIDDPPDPQYRKPYEMLQAARELPAKLTRLLAPPRARFTAALERFQLESAAMSYEGATVGPRELRRLAGEYEYAVTWLRQLAADQPIVDHMDTFFAVHVVERLAADLALTAAALRTAASSSAELPEAQVLGLYCRLAGTFSAELSCFERKRYVSLSHEPNKAMNLNSYIGLMGGRYREVVTPLGRALVPIEDGPADLVVPDCEYVLTLDADSVVLPEYCARLVFFFAQPQNERVAVAQTPYSAYPGAATRLERIAGATTDVQHIVHQGMTYYDATFWVGANAVMRKRALEDVAESDYVGGEWPIRRFIQDRTAIEDTESSIDLGLHDWKLYNYPERLSYSATPPDFGALCIQRQRWANGGLLILSKVWRVMRARRSQGRRNRFGEVFLRVNYMASIAWSSASLIFLFAFQFSDRLLSPLVMVVAVPYFLAMSSDLKYCGYKRLDTVRVYGFNLILLPVNLAGTFSSIVQGLTGAKGHFRRTPKVRERTVAGLIHVVLPFALVAFSAVTFVYAFDSRHWVNAGFAALNGVLATYAIIAFIGLRNSLVDIAINLVSFLHRPDHPRGATARPRRGRRRKAPPAPVVAERVKNWELVLHMGAPEEPLPAIASVAAMQHSQAG
jgi:cellulose synthase/poly-beta-1,6-N-acetylglucosamine synthase-like glycosyltransferase